ncbi:MAG TPA: hypothetical protein VN765_15630, partial [Candidatus Acidoferrum sp.]|nr:hypothetical protein [Candidatus Acidoferrum sp.]
MPKGQISRPLASGTSRNVPSAGAKSVPSAIRDRQVTAPTRPAKASGEGGSRGEGRCAVLQNIPSDDAEPGQTLATVIDRRYKNVPPAGDQPVQSAIRGSTELAEVNPQSAILQSIPSVSAEPGQTLATVIDRRYKNVPPVGAQPVQSAIRGSTELAEVNPQSAILQSIPSDDAEPGQALAAVIDRRYKNVPPVGAQPVQSAIRGSTELAEVNPQSAILQSIPSDDAEPGQA